MPISSFAVQNSGFSLVEKIRWQLERIVTPRCGDFFNYPLPSTLSEWTLEHATARELDPNMVLLTFMGGIAGADRGLTQIQTGEGRSNSLAMQIFVSAESGSGKSSAMQPVLDVYTDFEEHECARFESQAAAREARCEVLKQMKKEAIKVACNKRDSEDMVMLEKIIGDIQKLGRQKQVQPPCLFVNDVTSASLAHTVSRWGYANIMDPDGTSLDINTCRQVVKYWSGEGNAQIRMTRNNSIVRQPFVNCVVFTQPKFFRELVLAEPQKEMGFTARSLLYTCSPRLRGNGSRGVNETIMRSFKNKLLMLLENSAYDLEGHCPPKRILQVAPEGAEALRGFHDKMVHQVKFNREGRRVKDWCIRAAQQAYRVAGIFHLCEHDDPWASSVSTTEVEMAINFMWTAYDYVVAAVCPNHDQDTLKCILKIAEWCEEHSELRRVSNAEIKDAMRGSFRAQKVDIAISWLIDWGLLTVYPSPARYGSGRPLGGWYQNNAERMH